MEIWFGETAKNQFLQNFVKFCNKEKNMGEITFAVLLSQILEGSGIRYAKQAYEIIEQNGVRISYSTFANYKSFTTVPEFRIAKEILQSFDYECSDEELRSILEHSSRELKNMRDESRTLLRRGISINPEYYRDDLDADTLQDYIVECAKEELGPDATINEYINYLIKKDLTEKGYMDIDR